MYKKEELTAKAFKFQQQCLKFTEKHSGLSEPMFFNSDELYTEPEGVNEDDGALNITKYGLRACFGIGQDTPAKEANDVMRKILEGLEIKKYNPKHIFIDCVFCGGELNIEGECLNCGKTDEDDEDESCGSCGRSCDCY